MEKKYTADSIQVLEGLEAVRKRPGMYIGNVDVKGLHHLIWEIIDNSIDEVLAGYATEITVILKNDNSIIISDNGRGIPTETHPKTKISTVETVFTILHAGGKFGGSDSVYKVSGGLHGVGASVVNALSEYLEVNIYKDDYEYFVKFENGGKKTSGLIKIGPTDRRGTTVHFLPDFSIFNSNVEGFNISTIKNRLKEIGYLNKGLKINIEFEKDPSENTVYCFEGGIVDFVKNINKSLEKINQDPIYSEDEKENVQVEVAFQYTSLYQPRILSFVNNISTSEGGTHEAGFFDALYRILNNYVKDNVPQKDQYFFVREDIKEGLTAVISIKHPDPMYEGQTKNKFTNLEVRRIVNEIISEKFENYLLENPIQANLILSKIKLAAKARISAAKAKELTRRSDILGFSTLPGKLADCSSKDRDRTELFIVEGDSAGGSAKMGRDRETQAVLPLRGKVINAERTRMDKLVSNNEISSLITAIGTGIENEFDIEKLRYDKIIIMTDADVDGSHIRILLLTFFYRYFKKLIESGHIYIAQPPLYKISFGKKFKYIYNDDEKNKFVNELKESKENLKYSIQRYKGLGEMNYDQLWETTMNVQNRKLLKVEIDEVVRAEQVFVDLMGEFVEPRKEFIIKNAKFAKLDV